MSPLVALLGIVIGALLTVVAGGYAVRRGLRPGWTAAAYRDAAMALGLDADSRGVGISGYVGERRLWIGEVVEGASLRVEGRVSFERPLGLGLVIERGARRSRLLRRRPQTVGTGDAALDRELVVSGDDADRIHAWMTGPVREALASLLGRAATLTVTDDELTVGLASPPTSRAEIVGLAEGLLLAADAFAAARLTLPPPPALAAAVSRWSAFAAELGLTFDPAGPTLSGKVGDLAVVIGAGRVDEGYAAYVHVRLAPHPEIGLVIRPQDHTTEGQDLLVGEPIFDERFEIKGYDPDAVTRRLDPAVRQRLLALADEGELRIDDRTLLVDHLPLSPEALARVLTLAVDAARALGG